MVEIREAHDAGDDSQQLVATAPSIGIVFSALLLTMLMSSLGQMIFSTALPTIVGELGGVDHMSWVISAFLVTMTLSLIHISEPTRPY